MKRVLILVSGGLADYTADEGVDVQIFDEDLFLSVADRKRFYQEELKGFEDLMPDWVKDRLDIPK